MYRNERVDQDRIRNGRKHLGHETEGPLLPKNYFPEERGDVRLNPENTVKSRSAKIVENLEKIRQESMEKANSIKPASGAIKTLNKITEELKTLLVSAPVNLLETKTAIKVVKNSFWRRGLEKFKAFCMNPFGKQTQHQRLSASVIAYESKLQSVITKMTQILCKNYDTSITIEGEKIKLQSSLRDIIFSMSQEFQRIKREVEEYENPHEMLQHGLKSSIIRSDEFSNAIIQYSEKYEPLKVEAQTNAEELKLALEAIELLAQVKNSIDPEFVVQQLHLEGGSYSKDQITNRAVKAIIDKGDANVLNDLIKNSEDDAPEDALATAVVFENASVAIKAVSEPVQILGIHRDIQDVMSKESGVILISHFSPITRKEEIELYFNDGDGGLHKWIKEQGRHPASRIPVAIVNDITEVASKQNSYKCLVGVKAAIYLEQKIYG